MGRRSDEIAEWAALNGYDYQKDAEAFSAVGIKDMDSFRNWDGAENHVVGEYKGRLFEILDVTKYYKGSEITRTDQTMILLPGAVAELPDFEIVPRGLSFVTELFGLKGLMLSVPDHASDFHRGLVDNFNNNYGLYRGGMIETFTAAAQRSTENTGTDFLQISTICTRWLFEFLSKHNDWYIESQAGHLVVWLPSKTVDVEQIEAFLDDATGLLEILLISADKEPIVEVSMTGSFNSASVLGAIGGFFAGFFFALFCSFILVFLSSKWTLAIPFIAFAGGMIGMFLGKIIGKKIARS